MRALLCALFLVACSPPPVPAPCVSVLGRLAALCSLRTKSPALCPAMEKEAYSRLEGRAAEGAALAQECEADWADMQRAVDAAEGADLTLAVALAYSLLGASKVARADIEREMKGFDDALLKGK